MNIHQKIFSLIAFLAAVCLVVIVALAPRAAQAQGMKCGDRATLVKTLKDQFNETNSVLAIIGEASLAEVWVSPGGATWTFIVTDPNGRTCLVAAGKDWMAKPVEIEGKNS